MNNISFESQILVYFKILQIMSKLLILSCKIVFVVPSEFVFLFSFHFFDQMCTFDHKFKDILENYR